jgi:hypothetical protein
MGRKSVADDVEEAVLTKSARRCALCFGFDGTLERRQGQIAHIDRNHANSSEENLAYLCLEHHNEYDSRPSQSKRITMRELRNYRNRLHEAIARGDHIPLSAPRLPADVLEHERRVFAAGDALLNEADAISFLTGVAASHSYDGWDYRRVQRFLYHFDLESNAFVVGDLQAVCAAACQALEEVLSFLATHFFHFPEQQPAADREERGYRYCMHPDLNIDRSVGVSTEERLRYNQFARDLERKVNAAAEAFVEFRRTVKRTLLV